MGRRNPVKATELPPIEYVKALRDMGARRVKTPTIEIDFQPQTADVVEGGMKSAAARPGSFCDSKRPMKPSRVP